MDLKLTDKRALVTGSTAGIGLAIAASLAAEGAQVIVNGRTQERVDAAVAGIVKSHRGANVRGFAGNLGQAAGAVAITRQFPDVDILVNNLGIFEPKAFEEISDGDWSRFIEVNFMSGVRLSRAYIAGMRRRNWGRIIFISSESAVNIPVEMIHYGVTKTMQLALARGLAETTVNTAVTVNSVLPGPTASEGVEGFVEGLARAKGATPEQVEKEFFDKMRPGSLLKRFATTNEVASLVTYLASPLSSATNGAALRVEGGVLRSIL
jgi:NAD(P)-dependent dehydrogenase (short-subunit alcohol dehydrogenase family)